MTETKNTYNSLIIAGICAAYIVFRFCGMADSCLWFDEIFSVHAAEHSWETIISFVAKDLIHPPLFYVLLKLWTSLVGESVFWLRSLPVLFSILALFPFWMICRELKLKPPAAIVAMSLFAVNGSLIKYAQEVRMYSFLLFLSLFSIWLFSRFYFRGKNFWLLTLVNILLVYTHYFGWLVIIAEVVAILIAQRIKILRILLMLGVVFVTFLPWIFAVFRFSGPGRGIEQNIGWIARPGISSIFEFAFDVAEPFYFQQSSVDPSSIFIIAIPLLIIVAAAKIIYLINFKNSEEKDAIYLMSVFSVVPLAIAFLASWLLPVSVWGSRHVIVVFAPMIIIIAIFITSIGIKPIRLAFIASIYLLITVAFVVQMRTEKPQFIWCAWDRLATEWIATPHYSTESKKLYVFEDLVAYHFWFAIREMPNYEVKALKGIDGIQEDAAYFLPRGFAGVEKTDLANIRGDSFWIAFRESKPHDTSPGIPFITSQKPPLSTLSKRGLFSRDVRKLEIGNQVAYLIRMEKEPEAVPQH